MKIFENIARVFRWVAVDIVDFSFEALRMHQTTTAVAVFCVVALLVVVFWRGRGWCHGGKL